MMWLVFLLGIVSVISITTSNIDRKCITNRNNLLDRFWALGREGWRCTNFHPKLKAKSCILKNWFCDGFDFCGDGEDESEICGGFGEQDRTCINPFTKVGMAWRCKTGSKKCINNSFLCDGIPHCDKGEDEGEICGGFGEKDRRCVNPFINNFVRYPLAWRCRTGSKRCIPTSKLCDGLWDCFGGEDEKMDLCGGSEEDRRCTHPETGESKAWRCKTGNKTCIKNSYLCNGHEDCIGGEDEHEISPFCKLPLLHPGCRLTSCYTCAADKTILTSSEHWNGSVEQCRRCEIDSYPNPNLRRCNDGSCYDSKLVGCDGRKNCLDGSDELNCPWYIRAPATITLAVCFGVVIVSLIMFILLRKVKLIDTRVEYEGPIEIDLIQVDDFVAKMKTNPELDEESKQIYYEIHNTNQISILISALKVYFIGVTNSHKIAKVILEAEENIHGGRRQALLCLRVNAGSNADIERLLSFEEDPGSLKKVQKEVTQLMDAFLSQSCIHPLVTCFPNIKKWTYNITKMLIASVKVTLFLWDFVKDLLLWYLSYLKAEDFNFRLWFFYSLIFCAQSVVGFYITSEYKTILSIPNNMKTYKKIFVLISMFLLTPCLPSLVIFKATVYSTDMAAIVANARNNTSSQPSRVLQKINAIKEKHRLHSQIYAYARQGWKNV